ncbi:MAG: hypothetical protein DSY88_00210 [Candidatus Poseidoniales archaeon]|nr:MAG: hypothetical protein DSY88_00210 [Candidatus Poseidoniales archaeon]
MRGCATRVILLALVLLASLLAPSTIAAGGRAVTPDFGSGPDEGDVIGGSFTIVAVNTTDVDALLLELWDGSAWASIVNLSSSPWIHNWDTTGVVDGDYRLRMEGFDSGASLGTSQSGNFTVDNTDPANLQFAVLSPDLGGGSSISDRAWFDIPSTGVLSFTWNATDAHLSHAALTGVPGPGTPSNDGPGFFAYRWDWTTGSFPAQGTWTAQLKVFDTASNSATAVVYIGIDTVGPDVGTPTLSVGSGWTDATSLAFSGLNIGASDNGGCGIDHYEVRDSTDSTWTDIGSTGGGSTALQEGVRTIEFRAVDLLGNAGSATAATISVDQTNPVAGGWVLPELVTSLSGGVTVSVQASDDRSGIDAANTTLYYGFDANGIGDQPDVTNAWIQFGTGLTASLPSSIVWSTKQGQYLSLRAVLKDNASNSAISPVQHFIVLPSLDLSWESASVDRLVVRAGSSGVVNITSVLISNEPWTGSPSVSLQTAPADRDSTVNWTTMETRTLSSGSLVDLKETLIWSVTILTAGELDIRIVIDSDDAIAEKDEGNNEVYVVAQGAEPGMVGVVPGFMPDMLTVILAGLFVSIWMSRKRRVTLQTN